MIAFRANDGRTGNPLFTEGTLPGEWRALAVGGNNFQWVGEVRPFLIPDPEMFRTRGPLDLESADYAAEFNRVKALGRATGSTRTKNRPTRRCSGTRTPLRCGRGSRDSCRRDGV